MGPVPRPTRVLAETDTTIYLSVDLTGGNRLADPWQRATSTPGPMPAPAAYCGRWCWLVHRPHDIFHPADQLLAAAMEAARQHRHDRPPIIVLQDEAAQLLDDGPPTDPGPRQTMAELVRIGRSAAVTVLTLPPRRTS